MNKNKRALFTQSMEEHKGIIYKVVNSYCQSLDERQDLAQEILTTMWLAFDKYNTEFKFSTWMYRIALNVAISYYRKDRKHQDNAVLDDECLLLIVDKPKEGERSEEINLLYRFISQLDQLNKAIMLLYLENESYESIAQSLGISKTNVATRIGRIKEKLRSQFATQEP
ncbi:MAG: RNA polymerase sigma factor [Gammaproteobacteria bacterium]|nr:RNA polymerase sigma factor [Gammaproteobacteria bacterium]